ncbi:uncharacterized protein [Apostichopus japonicus]|uniref:uncharacterized protein isoform X2 n=1 Tax=Stichopus japonicus TaxID=307972 RepID=UPI003AB22C11
MVGTRARILFAVLFPVLIFTPSASQPASPYNPCEFYCNPSPPPRPVITCIKWNDICNGVNDCPDGEDEANCKQRHPIEVSTTVPTTTEQVRSITTTPPECSSDEFQCSEMECVPLRLVCDRFADCENARDEQNCNGADGRANPGTYGTYFVFAWPEALEGSSFVLSMMSVTNRTAIVNITIPHGHRRWTETILPRNRSSVHINQSYVAMGSRDLADVTVKVVSNYDISVTAMSENSGSLNTFQVLPVASLGEEYYVPLIYSTMQGIATISALSEETKVTIKFSRKVSVGKVVSSGKVVSTGDVIQQSLNSFQTYQVYISRADDQDDDHVVVMHLEADRPVAVVSGSICAGIPPGDGTCDYLVEQFPPFNQWGQRFTIPSFLNRKKYSMLVIAGRDKTVINTTDEDPFEMNQGEHSLSTVTGGLRSLESINPVLVVLFSTSRVTSEEGIGDPSMSIIPPHRQFLHGHQAFYIYPFESHLYMTHYLAVTSTCNGATHFTLDQDSISNRSNVTRRGTMCVSHLEVTPGYHTFRHEHDTASYMLMSYGFGLKVGYSHIISFNTSPVTCQAYDDIRDVTKEYMCEDVNQSFCPENETEDGGEKVSWPKSDIFKTINSTKICPLTFTKAGIPVWSRRCNLTDDLEVIWNDPIRNDCGAEITINKPEDLLTAEVTTGNVEEVSSTLQHITEEIEDISTDDVTDVAQTLTKVVGTGSSSKSVTNSVVRTVDTVLTDLSKAEVSDGQFNTMDTAFSTSEMVQMMDQQLQQTLEVEDNFTITEDAIQVQAFHLDATDNPGDYTLNPIKQKPEDAHTSVVLPKAIFATQETTVSVTFVLYRDDALFRPPSNSLKEKPTPELVLSVSVVTSTKIEKLLQPVVLNFPRPQNNRTISSNTSCVFWDFNENNGAGDWSEEGCKYAGATDDSVACECDHLTNFAVLMDYTDEVEEMSEAYTAFLDILTKIGCTVSIIGLIVTLVIFAIFKRLRTSRPRRILVHLCISLLCLYITFLFGIDSAINSEWACPMVAGLIHYFLLCAIFWMGVEAMNIYLMLVRVFNMNISRFVLKGAIAAWGGPLVIVGICMAASIEQYSDNGFCFLDQGNVFYIGLIAPMALVLIHNIIIFMLVFRNLMNANLAGTVHGKKTDMDLLKERLQNALTMTILMGLTWSFGFLMIGHTKFIFQLLFCLFNSFQGLLVFVLFCWRQEDVRKTLRPHCLSAKRKSKEVVGAKADYDITSTMTGQQSARVSTEVRKNVTSTGSTSSTVLLSPNKTKMNNNFRDSVSHV